MTEPHIPTRRIAALAMIVFLIGAAVWHLGGPIRPLRSLRSIEGVPGETVARAIGPPSEIDDDGNWVYRKAGNPGWLVIGFDKHGHVASVDHEYGFK